MRGGFRSWPIVYVEYIEAQTRTQYMSAMSNYHISSAQLCQVLDLQAKSCVR